MKSRFWVFLIIGSLIGTGLAGDEKKIVSSCDPFIALLNEITKPYVQEMSSKFDIYSIGGGGALSRDVEEVDIAFIANRKGSIKEGRRIIVQLIDELQKRINEKVELRRYLREYPLPSDRVTLSLAYRNEDSCFTAGAPVLIFQRGGYLYYEREDPKTRRLINIMKEEYSKAKEIVEKEKRV